MRLKLIDELQQTFRKILNELEELNFEEINLNKKFDDILVTLKSSDRKETTTFADMHQLSAPRPTSSGKLGFAFTT